MCAYITSIGTANPPFKINQKDVLDFMIKAHGLDQDESKQLKILYRASGIQHRYTTIQDYCQTDKFSFFPNNKTLEPFPSTGHRSDWYKKEALSLSGKAIKNCLDNKVKVNEITHLITVSCTGMYAPGLDIEIINRLGLPPQTERTAINFMGCYAAFNALKMANHICKAEDAKVLIVSTELCSIHFQKEKNENNLLANALFGDGSAAVLVESGFSKGIGLLLNNFICDLLPQAKEEMAWEIGDTGFEMKLSSYVPEAIKSGISPLINAIVDKTGHSDFDFYAVHPGGKKILEVVEQALQISKDENHYSHEILRDFGNMSSPTILFVLERILKSLDKKAQGKSLLGLAFGPGLTLESFTAKVVVK